MIYKHNIPPETHYTPGNNSPRLMPIIDAVKEKHNTLKSTRIYLIIGLVLTFVLFALPLLYVAGAAIAFYIITIFLTQKEIIRLEKKYLK